MADFGPHVYLYVPADQGVHTCGQVSTLNTHISLSLLPNPDLKRLSELYMSSAGYKGGATRTVGLQHTL